MGSCILLSLTRGGAEPQVALLVDVMRAGNLSQQQCSVCDTQACLDLCLPTKPYRAVVFRRGVRGSS
jgi:hypothetical protein